MYNLALCHVALGSYAESLNLLRMVLDDDGPYQHQQWRGGGIPIDLVKVITEYQAFVQLVLRVQQRAASSNAAAASATAEEGAESMDIETVDDEAEGTDFKATAATADEDGLPLPASAA